MKIVIGGSRDLTQLNLDITQKLQGFCDRGLEIFVGDANGIDKAVQKFLHDFKYQRVTVYCMDAGCRNNVGSWPTQRVSSSYRKNSFEYFSSKDHEMAKKADSGFMIWNSRSKGSLINMIYLLQLEKQCLVYFHPNSEFFTLKNSNDLDKLLSYCDKKTLASFESSLGLSKALKKIKLVTFKQTTLGF